MGAKNGTGRKATAEPPKKLDLDAFKVEAPKVTINGTDYELQPFTLGNYVKFADLRKGFEVAGADVQKQIEAALAVYRFLIPNAPPEVIDGLGPGQQEALSSFWMFGTAEQIGEDEKDAKDVIANPTPPG